MPKTIYKCNQCGKAYSTYQEANNCERSHSINYDIMSRDSVVEKLRKISDDTHFWNADEEILGMDKHSFRSLINRMINLFDLRKKVDHFINGSYRELITLFTFFYISHNFIFVIFNKNNFIFL